MVGSKEYLNGKLEANTHYAVFQRSFDDYGSYDSEKFIFFKTKKSFPLVTVVVIVVVIVAAVLVAIAIYFYKGEWMTVIPPRHPPSYYFRCFYFKSCSKTGWTKPVANFSQPADTEAENYWAIYHVF